MIGGGGSLHFACIYSGRMSKHLKMMAETGVGRGLESSNLMESFSGPLALIFDKSIKSLFFLRKNAKSSLRSVYT
jgi:hypothetical protein